ncbi:hypothetical protein FACS189425_03240 [Clostridia bacterium]|nr:hypothetical protein FACS189425_03240 [Clostridia bacterium]
MAPDKAQAQSRRGERHSAAKNAETEQQERKTTAISTERLSPGCSLIGAAGDFFVV